MSDTTMLDAADQARLDLTLEAARKLHYVNLTVAALSLLLLAPGVETVSLPLLGVSMPKGKAIVPLYVLSTLLAAANDRLAMQAYRWLPLDPRRVPFPWHALGRERVSYWTLLTWVFLPVVITGAAVAVALWPEAVGPTFLLPGLLVAGSQRVHDRYAPLVHDRRDHRGGPATFSMWLLYLYRIVRNRVAAAVCLALVLGAIPELRARLGSLAGPAGIGVIVVMVGRAMAGLLYRPIDRLGVRWGFTATNQHDYPAKGQRRGARPSDG